MSARQTSLAGTRRLHLGPQQPAGRPRASRVSWELLFPGGPNCGLRLRGEYRTRRAELLRETVRSLAPTGLTLGVGPERCEARPSGQGGAGCRAWWSGRNPEGSGWGAPSAGERPAGGDGGGESGRRRLRSARLSPLRCSRASAGAAGAALARRRRRRPHLPASRAAAPGPRASWPMALAPGRGGRTGGPEAQRRAAVQTAGAPGRRRGPGGGGLGARSPGLGPRRSERESKTGNRAVSPGAALSPPGLTAVPGERVPEGLSRAKGGGSGGGSKGGRAGRLLPEAPAPGRPAWAAGVTQERPPPRGTPVGINFTTIVSSPGRRLHFAPRVAVAVLPSPALLARPRSRWAPARAPASAPSPARGLPPLRPAGRRQRRCSSAHYFKSPEYDLTRTERHSEREGESERGGESCSPLSSTFR